jgi:hypothetical protein
MFGNCPRTASNTSASLDKHVWRMFDTRCEKKGPRIITSFQGETSFSDADDDDDDDGGGGG